jgi:peptidoglycan/xylan/chitin deacetylase (PgdA/CDA1 family)
MRRLRTGLGIALGTLALLIGGWQLSKSRSFQLYGGLVTRVETEAPLVALTLDDGPTPAGTEATLALLDSLGIRATFFVTGRELEQHPGLGRRIVAAGHALGNHSYSHRQMVLHTPTFVRREVERTDSLIRAVGWQGTIPFRPPYGKRLFVLPRYLHHTGRSTVLWDVEPESYREVAASAERIAAHVVARVRPGSIVLLHVMYPSCAESRRALPLIVDGLRAQGYRFVTVQELLEEHGAASNPPP